MVTIPSHISSISDSDGAVILNIRKNELITLNTTGAYIWQRLQRGMRAEAIVAELALETGTEKATIAEDLAEFIEDLKAQQLISQPTLGCPTEDNRHV